MRKRHRKVGNTHVSGSVDDVEWSLEGICGSLPIIPQLSEGRQTTEETQCRVRLQCGTRAISRHSKRVPFDTRLNVIQRLGRDTPGSRGG